MNKLNLARYKSILKLAIDADTLQDETLIKRLKVLGLEWDEKFAQGLERDLQIRKAEKDLSLNPFHTQRKEEIEGFLARVGFVDEEKVFGLTEERLKTHILLCGQSRIGKTQTIYLIISSLAKRKKILVIDFKRDYRGLVRILDDIIVLRWSDLKINPLASPPFVKSGEWLQVFSDIFSQAFGLLYGSNFYLRDKVNTLYETFGVYSGSKNYPSLFELEELLESKQTSGRVTKDYQERIKNRVKEVILSLGSVVDCSFGYPLEDLLLQKNVVLEMDGLSRALSIFLVNLLLSWIFVYRINRGERGDKVTNVIVIDEAKRIFDKNLEKLPVEGIPIITTLVSQIGEFNIGLIIGEQIPSMLANGIKANTGTVISFRLSNGKDIQEMAKTMNLKKKETEYFSRLSIGQAIVRTIGVKEPFLMKVPDISSMIEKNISPEELSESKRPLLNYSPIPRKILLSEIEKEKLQASSLSPDELIFLADIVNHFNLSFTARTKSLGITNYKANRIKKNLLDKGLIKEESIKLKSGRGKPELFLELTSRGYELLGIRPLHKGKGGLFHRLAQELIANYYRKRECKVEKEKLIEGRLIDIVIATPENKIIPIEVETGQSDYVEKLEFNLRIFQMVVIVTPIDQKIKEKIERNILKELEENKRKRVIFHSIDYYVDNQDKQG